MTTEMGGAKYTGNIIQVPKGELHRKLCT